MYTINTACVLLILNVHTLYALYAQDMKVVWCPHEGCGHGLLPSAVAATNGRRDSDDVAWRVTSSSNGYSSNRLSFVNSSNGNRLSFVNSSSSSSGKSSASTAQLMRLHNGSNSMCGSESDMPLQHSVHARQPCETPASSTSSSSSSRSAKRGSPKRSSAKVGKQKQKTANTSAATAAAAAATSTTTTAAGQQKPTKPAVPAFASAAATSSSNCASSGSSMIENEQDWVLVDNGRKGSADSCCSDTDTTIATASTGIDSKGAVSAKADVTAATTVTAAGPVVECLACGRSVCMLCGK
jgi:hypothetical protein